MTRTELVEWLEAHNCYPEPLKGINNTANAVRFVNSDNKRYTHVYTPIDDRHVADFIVYRVCTALGIPVPDCAKDQDDTDDQIRSQFGDKR